MQINGIELDPAVNPAVLDTLTWDEDAALNQIQSATDDIQTVQNAAISSGGDIGRLKQILAQTPTRTLKLYEESLVIDGMSGYMLIGLPDGQRVFVNASLMGSRPALPAFGEVLTGFTKAYICPVNTDTVSTFVTRIAPQFSPKASGTTPRLGVGNRQTVTVWPGIFKAMREIGGPGEIIQNSAYRELAPAAFILSPPSDESAYMPGHGSVNIGHTGSSIEGLWLAGVVSALENGFRIPYGADLDHIPVKGLDENSLAKAKLLIDAGRHYTFFTIDASALFKPDANDLSIRYGDAIEAATYLYEHIKSLKGRTAFDFEFSLDEGPTITDPEEQEFVLKGLKERGVTVHFIAPNVGFEKRFDYRRPDGLSALEDRVRVLSKQAETYGAVLDFHSGSDKSPETYQTISRACNGKLKLKVSGKLQLILSEVLADLDPEFFNEWWDWTLDTARGEAERGSDVASRYIGVLEERKQSEVSAFQRSSKDLFFTDFSFAMVGARDDNGGFMFRDRFYSLKPDILQEYENRTTDYVTTLAHDLNLYR